ncbi:MAG: type IV pilus assembly protein PilM [Fimbriimonadales bacterium]
MSLSLFAKERFIGIDIGHSNIKLAQVEPAGSKMKVTGVGIIPTPPGAVGDGVCTDPQSVGSAIRQAMREYGLSATTANVAVAGAPVVVRTVKMPAMPEATLRKSIRFEAGRYVPSSVEDSYIECEVIGELEDGQMEVLVVASPKDLVESRVAAAEAAGLDVEIVDTESFALFRTLVEMDQAFHSWETAIAIVDLGDDQTKVSVVDGGRFALTRCIPIGGRALTQALQTYFKLSEEEAENGKHALDLRPLCVEEPMENPPLRVIQPMVDELLREVRRSLNYFQSQQADQRQARAVSNIYLCGGGSLMAGARDYFAHKLGLTVELPDPFDNPTFSSDISLPYGFANLSQIALGLGVRRPSKVAVAA